MKKEKPQWKSIVDLFVFPQLEITGTLAMLGEKVWGWRSVHIFIIIPKIHCK